MLGIEKVKEGTVMDGMVIDGTVIDGMVISGTLIGVKDGRLIGVNDGMLMGLKENEGDMLSNSEQLISLQQPLTPLRTTQCSPFAQLVLSLQHSPP